MSHPELPPEPRVAPPPVRLGPLRDRSLAPAFFVIVERGVRLRPALAAGLLLEAELKVEGPYPSVRVSFARDGVTVGDDAAQDPDLRIEGGMADLVSLLVAPVGPGGVPNPLRAEGRRAIGKLALGQVRIEGRIALVRRVLALIHI